VTGPAGQDADPMTGPARREADPMTGPAGGTPISTTAGWLIIKNS
jgi:hypothetical protein